MTHVRVSAGALRRTRARRAGAARARARRRGGRRPRGGASVSSRRSRRSTPRRRSRAARWSSRGSRRCAASSCCGRARPRRGARSREGSCARCAPCRVPMPGRRRCSVLESMARSAREAGDWELAEFIAAADARARSRRTAEATSRMALVLQHKGDEAGAAREFAEARAPTGATPTPISRSWPSSPPRAAWPADPASTGRPNFRSRADQASTKTGVLK